LSTLANQAAIALRNAQLYHEVHTSQQYTQAILEHLDSAVLTVGPNEKIVVANEAARTLLPSPNGFLLLPPTLRSAVRRVFETLQEQADIEFDLLSASETVTPVVATVSPFLTDTGRVENVLVIIRDITVLRRLEDERLRAERLSSATRVAATLAHEIRNPLASIKTFCQLLPEKYLDVEFREGFSQLALQEVDRIDALVSNLLVSGRSTKGKWEPVSLNTVVHSILQFIQPMMMDNGLRLDYRCEDSLPTVMGDASQLRQLFLNLLLNARQAAPDGSVIEVCLLQQDGRVVGTVHNGGTPISPNDLPRLFDPFFTTHERGTGLGLTVCKQVTEYHRGEISVKSSEELGTTFSLSLPSAGGFA
ncbi:MAG: ATP-binding protein, partial [Armatimonadota bacterium]|nr:ATP-binding protein [Armatimonadota bacterium]